MKAQYNIDVEEVVAQVTVVWTAILPLEYLPELFELRSWVCLYPFDIIEKALHSTTRKLAKMGGEAGMSREYCINYAHACMRNMAQESGR